MFPVKVEHVKRVTFATRLFPKLKSAIGLETSNLKSTDKFDGEVFCGGRSKNKDLLSYFGLIHDASGNFAISQLPILRRSIKKLTNLVEQELEFVGAQEILLPTLVSKNLWNRSKRIERQHNALDGVFKLTDDAEVQLLLGPTFEESVTQLVAQSDSVNESDLPILLYQTSSKFRREPNPRFGLLRTNEFLMNDLYSFDADLERAIQTYEKISSVYSAIFNRLGLECIKVQGELGNIGGKYSHEYHLPVQSGEDIVYKCEDCHNTFNVELYSNKQSSQNSCSSCKSTNISQIQALELGHTFLLSDTYSSPLKARFTTSNNIRKTLEMGCFGLGLSRIIGGAIDSLSIIPVNSCEDNLLQIRWPNEIEPYTLGIVIPAKRSQQYHLGSSSYVKELVYMILESTKNTDIFIEDRDKESIGRRIFKLKSLGIPNIIVIGSKFLQDNPEIELQRLKPSKKEYEQLWFSKEQVCDYLQKQDKRQS